MAAAEQAGQRGDRVGQREYGVGPLRRQTGKSSATDQQQQHKPTRTGPRRSETALLSQYWCDTIGGWRAVVTRGSGRPGRPGEGGVSLVDRRKLRWWRPPSDAEIAAALRAETGQRSVDLMHRDVLRLAYLFPHDSVNSHVRMLHRYGSADRVVRRLLVKPVDIPPAHFNFAGLYEGLDVRGRWWPITVTGLGARPGFYSARVHDEGGTTWPAVHPANIRALGGGGDGGGATGAEVGSHPPEQLLCPITKDVMVDPCTTRYGHSFERSALLEWLESEQKCPLTRQPLTEKDIVRNRVLQELSAKWSRHRDASESAV
eukprot:TRINITY_DN4435_c3_g1_i1.p1 TRINITY_DN4435_c3_g1~~TRINITY_DN4435_c3_g1_i1.p1  ORF type:complete len:333 (+),score=87.05 TRINITY_DN4435_c3_g1_i1:54-1001(+)